jgi:diguanylate cyclase (GGDEF)-like protein/PAS domain S-box-containing protein
LLGWLQNPPVDLATARPNSAGAFALVLLSTALCGLLFYPEADQRSLLTFSPLLLVPLLLWAAHQYGVRGVTLLGAVISMSATLGSAQGRGLFSSLPDDVRTVVLQQFLASLLITGLAIAAILNDLKSKNLSSRLFKEAAEHMYEGLTITNANLPDYPIIYANPKFEELTGYKAEEFLGKNCRFLNMLHRDQLEIKMIREAIANKAPLQCTVQYFKKDGTPFWNLLTISPIKDQLGAVTHFIGIQRDVTKIIETADQLLQANTQLSEANQILEERVVQRTADLERLATTDPLTGFFNRRYWMKRAEIEIASAQRQSAPLSIVMLDIDHSKRINDKFGHPTGDLVLVNLCTEVQKILRTGDTFARIGGEEFVLLLPRADEAFAVQVAERVRALLASMVVRATDQTSFSFTASLGVATLSTADQTIDSLLANVDSALYHAKDAGRNRVMTARY